MGVGGKSVRSAAEELRSAMSYSSSTSIRSSLESGVLGAVINVWSSIEMKVEWDIA